MVQRLQWDVQVDDDHARLELVGDLDVGTARDLQKALDAVSGHRLVVVDLDGVPFCGLRGMRILLDTAEEMAERGGTLVLARAQDVVVRLMDRMRVRQEGRPVPGLGRGVAVSWDLPAPPQ